MSITGRLGSLGEFAEVSPVKAFGRLVQHQAERKLRGVPFRVGFRSRAGLWERAPHISAANRWRRGCRPVLPV